MTGRDLWTPGIRLFPWIHPDVEMRPSPVAGKGMFARRVIHSGEVVCRWGGVIYTHAEIQAGRANPDTIAVLDEGLYLADPVGNALLGDASLGEPPIDDYSINHSCDPNLWMQDAITLVARRDIAAGEELAADYALWLYGVDWALSPCLCGSRFCSGLVSGQDWQLPELQERYAGHFTPFLNRLIHKRRLEHIGTLIK